MRRNLQKKGTKSAKRHLVKIKRKERQFKAEINHIISKDIISSLNAGDTIVLENLTGIRKSKMRKAQRYAFHSWNFFELQRFIIYKALAKGIRIVFIDPRNTSRTCSKCDYCNKGNRKSQSDFCCLKCEFAINADLNASCNIRNKYLDSISR